MSEYEIKTVRDAIYSVARKIARLRTFDKHLQLESVKRLTLVIDQLNQMIDRGSIAPDILRSLRDAIATVSRDVSMMKMQVDYEIDRQTEILRKLSAITHRLDRVIDQLERD